MRPGQPALVRAAVLMVVLGAGEAAASEPSELQGPYIEEGPIAFRAGLDFRWMRREASLYREFDCLAHETIEGRGQPGSAGPSGRASLCPEGSRIGLARDLRAESFTSLLDIDLRLAFYRTFEVRLKLPFVLSDETRLTFDRGVDERNSLTAPYNGQVLFDVPHSAARAGLGDPVLGLWVAPYLTARDPGDPELVFGLELGFPLAPARTPGGDAAGSGAWALTVAMAGSQRALPWIAPFFRLAATFGLPASDALYPDLGGTQATRGPPHEVGARFGVELIPFERPAEGNAVRIEIGGELQLVTAGKSASDLFDALGTSSCDPAADCELTTHAVGTRAPGTTIVEEHLVAGTWLGVHYDVLETLRFTARASVGWETPHFLTSSKLGVDTDGRGVQTENSEGVNEHDPDYNPHLDAPGTRFRSSEALRVGVELAVVGRF